MSIPADWTKGSRIPVQSDSAEASQGLVLLLLPPYSTFIMSLTSCSCPATTVALADRSNPVTGRPPGSVR